MPGNTNAGEDRVGATSYHLLQYFLRVFEPRDSTISSSVIHCDDHGSSICAKEPMKASTEEFTHILSFFLSLKEHEEYLIIPDTHLVEILHKRVSRGQDVAEMRNAPHCKGCS